MKRIFTILIIALSINAFAQQWITKTPLPSLVNAPGIAVLNNIIYVIGGSNENAILNTVFAYDPSNDTWSTKAPMTFSRTELSVAAVNGKIYAIGGYADLSAVNIVEEYDPASNTWTTKAPMPTSRSVISCGVINNKIYVVGGWSGGLTSNEEYTPETNTWAIKAPFPFGIMSINACAVINNKLFYIGGKNTDGIATTTNQSYDPISDTWTSNAALPQQRLSGATSVLNGEIHFMGGSSLGTGPIIPPDSPNSSDHYIYNSTTNTWSNGLSMLHKRANQVAATVNNKIYVIGGVDSLGVVKNWNEEYSLCSSSATITPSNNQLQIGNTASFLAMTSDINPSYIWQSDFGQGFQTLNNYGNYLGVNTNSLSLSNVQLANHAQPIRVISTSGECIDTSDISYISIIDTCIYNINDTTFINVTDTLIINTNITSINSPNISNSIKVFPNPANSHITIDYGNFTIMNGYQLKIENSLGQQLFQTNITQQTDYLSLSSWGGNGLYFIHIIDAQGNTIDIRKIVLQ
jgi:N-acetylneuraminic acid mutarotase